MATADLPSTTGDATERTERARMAAAETSWALRECTRAALDVDYALARRVGLRPMDYAALTHVFTGEGAMSPQLLSDRLGISTGSASELVDRLERAGHVERHRDRDDRRRVSLHPTQHSVAQVLGELAPLFDRLDALAVTFTAAERSAITAYLREAARALRDFEASGTSAVLTQTAAQTRRASPSAPPGRSDGH